MSASPAKPNDLTIEKSDFANNPSACRLCGLPARSKIGLPTGEIFCCNGCRNVWSMIVASGQNESGEFDPKLSPIYQQALRLGLIQRQEDAFDSLTTISKPVEVSAPDEHGTVDDTRQCVLAIDGMWCASCAWLISEVLQRDRGVVRAEVSFTSDTARVIYKPARTDIDTLREIIQRLGYQSVEESGDQRTASQRDQTRRREIVRAGIALFFAMNVMMLAPVIYSGRAGGLDPIIAHFVPWMLLFFSIPVFVCAWPLYDRAIRAARHGAATMETLVTVGATSALVYSISQIMHGSTRSYFDTADMLLGLVLAGKLIENSIRSDATDAVSLLRRLMPKKAIVVRDGREIPVASAQLAEGDVIRIRAGETIAADSKIQSGSCTVDESLLSGEATPVTKQLGESLTGGSIVASGTADCVVIRPIKSGTLSAMTEMVQESLHRKATSERLADRISRIFVPIVITLAFLTAVWVYSGLHGTVGEMVERSVAVLVIACPCALGIATPMAIMAGVASAAHRGILIGDPDTLDRMTKVRHLIFDKTGTLTEGVFRVQHVEPESAEIHNLGALERGSQHAIAQSLRQYCGVLPAEFVCTDFEQIDGLGVTGAIDGVHYFAGNLALAEKFGVTTSAEIAMIASTWSNQGLTVVYYGHENQLIAALALGDALRSTSCEAAAKLHTLGITTEIVSGDSELTVAAIANQTGILEFQGGVLPGDKAKIVAERQLVCPVGMIGDGVNDAPGLAQADVGIAMAAGADIAGKAASATLVTGNLNRIADLVAIATETSAVIRQNLFWACAYNVVCIPLAILGIITPIWAAIAMLISSITVLANTRILAGRLGKI